MKSWYGELPSGDVVLSSRNDVIVNEVYYRYERRDGKIHSVGYKMIPTDDAQKFMLEEVYAKRWDGVL